jgi:hypothetical protein
MAGASHDAFGLIALMSVYRIVVLLVAFAAPRFGWDAWIDIRLPFVVRVRLVKRGSRTTDTHCDTVARPAQLDQEDH